MGAPPLGFLYSPFTAVDEKIPLSVVQVNSKPQYLVFSSHFRCRLAKSASASQNTANFAVESANSLAGSGLDRFKIAQNPVQSRIGPRCLSSNQAYAPLEVANKAQDRCKYGFACGSCGH
jgi:hypothetical protein